MPTVDDPRITVRLPRGLFDRLPKGGRSVFVREALEAALSGSPTAEAPSARTGGGGSGAVAGPATSPRAPRSAAGGVASGSGMAAVRAPKSRLAPPDAPPAAGEAPRPFVCSVAGCGFEAGSALARCFAHNRLVRPR
jgi:hypothetical protein